MKRYLVFHWENYEAGGGMEDFINDFDDLQEAIASLGEISEYDRAHVWDTEERKIAYKTYHSFRFN